MILRNILHSLTLSIICAITSGCSSSGVKGDYADSIKTVSPRETDLTSEATAYSDSLLNCLTLEQRVGQCFMPSIYSRVDEATVRRFRSYISDLHVGGIVLLKGDVKSAALLSDMSLKSEVPLFIAIDAEWGLGMRLEDAPDFPRNGRIGEKADEELLFEYGSEVARECRRIGINMVLGPVVDVVENPGGIIGSRSFGGDPVRVAELGTAYARGLEGGRVISVAKHFPGHGSPSADSHRTLPVIRRSLHQLDSIDLYPFRHYIESGLSGVMVGHLAVPAVDPHSLPAAVSSPVIDDLLRGELGFRGLVLTDALNMGGAEGYGAVAALMAGADIVISPADTGREIAEVVEGVRKGEVPVSVIDDRCRRILFYKYLVREKSAGVMLEGIREDVRTGTDSLRLRLER
ncbi:MAG: glycosyl hydrolase family 3 [Muribaculaceae bacterium]|nr:glycosyl hydrolase family 3 [Muribaculaceae bacterium]